MVSDMIYLDNAATTPLHPKAREAMLPHLSEIYANPSSVYGPAQQARKMVDEVRQTVARALSAGPQEVYFTSCGTESNNWAIQGALQAHPDKKHIITTAIEHPAIANLCDHLKTLGAETTYLPVNHQGNINLQDLKDAIRPDTCIVTVMLANNEVGTILPLAEISEITKAHNILLHTDAVQAVGHIPVDVNQLGVDMLSLSAHKFGGPKGIGALYIRKTAKVSSLIHGGMQERNRRAGTENMLGIVGMGAALQASLEDMPREKSRITAIRDRLINEITTQIPHTRLNGATGDGRLPGNVSISFDFIEGESLLLHLDMHKCYASTGSACSTGALDPSHVLMAMGMPHEQANGTIRFSLGRENTDGDIDKLLKILKPSVQKLRDLSPLYEDYMNM